MIDSEIIKAIKIACEEAGQDESFAKKIIKWAEAASTKSIGPMEINDHLNVAIQSINLDKKL